MNSLRKERKKQKRQTKYTKTKKIEENLRLEEPNIVLHNSLAENQYWILNPELELKQHGN